tara:strand:+ start:461 stop:799 length:339 start_codon:yes stop_codon:yes gene_type:complete
MFKLKIFISILIFSFLLIATSIVKNQTRKIEKEISFYQKVIHHKEKDINETQLDFFYLTSPIMIEEKILLLSDRDYLPMEYSRIFLNISNFLNIENKLVIKNDQNEKKIQKK